ncbi:uncharacterized MFS-type transporter C09D4.1-like isoform X2 [Planococcus citri]|uniref:uncharacterized MFS-type transporter C09D4.1-like isoform X2 n=1 Tax=Planococcus citri TaxID=170843 RepID=UPI0031F7D908
MDSKCIHTFIHNTRHTIFILDRPDVAPDRFYLAFIGQCCSASFLKLTYGLFGRFTAIWFGADEISTAGVLVVLGDHLGSAFSYILPAIMVDDGSEEVIGNGLRNMYLSVSISSTVIFFSILFFLQTKPKIPPSIAQVKQKQVKKDKILSALGKMMRKPAFLWFILSFGLNCATSTSVAICLNEIIVTNFPDATSKDVGNIGFVMMFVGIFGSLLVGKMLDKTKLFKEYSIVLTICTTISMIAFTWSLKSGNVLFVYAAALLIGFFVTGYYSSGMQLGIELTYPIHEEISTTITFLSGALFSLITTVAYGYMIKIYGDLISNIVMIVLNIIAVVATLCIKVDLKRQRAENEPKASELKEFIK